MTSVIAERLRSQPDRLFPNTYVIDQFTEQQRPDLALIAQQVQARGYRKARFVLANSIVCPEGTLHPSVDEARGPNVDYMLARNPDYRKLTDRATLRHINLSQGGSVSDLPAYEKCGAYMSSEGREWLKEKLEAGRPIREVASMAADAGENGPAIYEMLRHSIQEALGKGETWFFSIVGTSIIKLTESLGASNFRILGEPVAMNNPLINPNITLQPVALEPDAAFRELPNLLERARWSAGSDRSGGGKPALAKAIRTILFFTDGVSDEKLGPDLARTRLELVTNYQERRDIIAARRTAS